MEKEIIKINALNDILDKYDNFFFDMDGVLWRGDEYIPNSLEFLKYLDKLKKNVYFFTNNSSVARKNYLDKLTKYGYTPKLDNIYCSSYICSSYLKKNHPEIKKVYIIGMEGLVDEFKSNGYEVIGGKSDDDKNFRDCLLYGKMLIDPEIKAVIVGVDYAFSYYKLCYASACIQSNQALFFATNEDPNMKVGLYKIPGAGTISAALSKASETNPIVTGKPNPLSINLLCEKEQFDKKRCLMIGDSFFTDVPFASNAGIDSLLVLTGVTNFEEMKTYLGKDNMAKPTYYAEDLRLFI